MSVLSIEGRSLVAGRGQGSLLHADLGLSFWGGVDPFSGEVIDRHHPLSGQSLAGRVLAIPSGRGSCTGSSVLLELILNGPAPAALVLAEPDEILSLGALVAEHVFDVQLPVLCIGHAAFAELERHTDAIARIDGERLQLFTDTPDDDWRATPIAHNDAHSGSIVLSERDRAILAGEHGKAAQVAMQLVLRMAELQGARELLDVTQAHIDGCIYTGPASLRFARQLADWGGKVKVRGYRDPATKDLFAPDPGFDSNPGAGTFGVDMAMARRTTALQPRELRSVISAVGECGGEDGRVRRHPTHVVVVDHFAQVAAGQSAAGQIVEPDRHASVGEALQAVIHACLLLSGWRQGRLWTDSTQPSCRDGRSLPIRDPTRGCITRRPR